MSDAVQMRLAWEPPGPIAARFMNSDAQVPILNGPVGSGKTTAALMKAIRLAAKQKPSPRRRALLPGRAAAPVRMFKLCVVRDTYRQLWRSTLPSWWKRVPKDAGDWSGGENGPGRHSLTFALGDGTVVEFQADFIAIGEYSVEDVMRGYEPTWFYLNEADLLPWEVFEWASSRWGRYPDTDDGGPTTFGCMMDCNAPQLGTEFYNQVFKGVLPEGMELFRQPGGRDPVAENLANLPPGYYPNMVKFQPEAVVRRLVDNLPGFTLAGKPVHPQFNDRLHVAAEIIEPIPGLPIYVGFDAGLDPAAIFAQKLGNGRWNFIDELVSEHGTGPLRFARNLNELLSERYHDWQAVPLVASPWGGEARSSIRPSIRGTADPSAAYGADKQDEASRTWIELVAYHTGIRIDPAPTNDTTTRREVMRRVLELMPDGRPAFQLSPRCEVTREGLNGGFRFRKMQIGGVDERYTDEVEKNRYSHICEAGEYVLLGGGEGAEIHERRQRGWNIGNLPRQAISDVSLP